MNTAYKILTASLIGVIIGLVIVLVLHQHNTTADTPDNILPVQEYVDCWNNERGDTAPDMVDTTKLEATSYCLVIPDADFDY